MTDARFEPSYTADERTLLNNMLDFHRDAIVRKADGLYRDALRASPVPSAINLMGLIHHQAAVHDEEYSAGCSFFLRRLVSIQHGMEQRNIQGRCLARRSWQTEYSRPTLLCDTPHQASLPWEWRKAVQLRKKRVEVRKVHESCFYPNSGRQRPNPT